MSKKKSRQVVKALFIMVLSLVLAVSSVTPVQAATAHMKNLNVSWDLKPNKAVTFKTKYSGDLGMKNWKVTVKNYKVSSAEKGYKKVKFTVVFNPAYKPSKKDVHKIVNDMEEGYMGGTMYCAVIDYKTGKSLEAKNKENVTVTSGEWKYSDKYYYDDDGCKLLTFGTVKKTMTVTYPETYKNLCIAVGGSTGIYETAKDMKFWEGKAAFGKTSYYSKSDKSVCHVMRVN